MYIISACLVGENVKYNGGNNDTPWVKKFAQEHHCYFCCPEILGGQPCPRPPAERVGDKIVNTRGEEGTESFVVGAALAWKAAKEQAARWGEDIEGAILKSKSPSCGRGKIYDGTFSHQLVDGDGEFVKLLRENGIEIITEKEKIDD
ncbi:MAG: DUF523 domain-containing protein [Anaerovoracaceae bacterium]